MSEDVEELKAQVEELRERQGRFNKAWMQYGQTLTRELFEEDERAKSAQNILKMLYGIEVVFFDEKETLEQYNFDARHIELHLGGGLLVRLYTFNELQSFMIGLNWGARFERDDYKAAVLEWQKMFDEIQSENEALKKKERLLGVFYDQETDLGFMYREVQRALGDEFAKMLPEEFEVHHLQQGE